MQTGEITKESLDTLALEQWKQTVSAQILARLQENLAQYYPELAARHEVRAMLNKPPRRRRFTVIFEIGLRNRAGVLLKSLIAKAYRITPKAGARDQDIARKSQREFTFHRQVYAFFAEQSDEYSVVRPVDYFPDLLTLIIEKAEGADLGELIQVARYSLGGYLHRKSQLGKYFQRAGKWLALMHRGFAAEQPARFEAAHFEERVNHYYERFKRVGGKRKVAEPIRDRILALRHAFTHAFVPQAHLHGDFKLRHIFVTEDRVSPIDFGNELAGAAYDDVARLLVEIKLLEYGFALPMRRELMRYLQEQFLHGYFGAKRWHPVLRYYYLVWLWAKWDRRLKKLATNKLIKKVDKILQATGVKSIINQTYVNGWFQRELLAEIEILEKEVGIGKRA